MYSVSDVTKRIGVSRSTLLYYEKVALDERFVVFTEKVSMIMDNGADINAL